MVGDVEVLDVEAVVVVLVVEVVDGVGVLIGADAVVSLRVDGRTHVDRSVVVGGGPVHAAAVAEHGVGAVGAAIHVEAEGVQAAIREVSSEEGVASRGMRAVNSRLFRDSLVREAGGRR